MGDVRTLHGRIVEVFLTTEPSVFPGCGIISVKEIPEVDPNGNEMMERAKALVRAYIDETHEKTDSMLGEYTVYAVWFTKTLQNWKALVSSTLPDGKYYEITHNGNKRETYVDVYVKVANYAVADTEV